MPSRYRIECGRFQAEVLTAETRSSSVTGDAKFAVNWTTKFEQSPQTRAAASRS